MPVILVDNKMLNVIFPVRRNRIGIQTTTATINFMRAIVDDGIVELLI